MQVTDSRPSCSWFMLIVSFLEFVTVTFDFSKTSVIAFGKHRLRTTQYQYTPQICHGQVVCHK